MNYKRIPCHKISKTLKCTKALCGLVPWSLSGRRSISISNLYPFLLAIFSFAFISAPAQTLWNVNTSSITFKIKNAGITVSGSFDSLVANIKFDSANYFKSSIEASIRVNSINTGIALRNKHLRTEYFETDKYPKIKMVSTLFAKEGRGKYKGYFKLTIKDVTKEVVIPFTYKETSSNAKFDGNFTLNRIDYHVGGNSLIMGNDVTVNIVVEVKK